jgi:hypothetical protein
MSNLPERINAMKCITYDVQQIVESLMAEQENANTDGSIENDCMEE